MTYLIDGIPAARTDILHAIEYYNAGKSGLDSDFFAASQEILAGLASQPKLYRIIQKKAKVRKAKLGRFPYQVFYQASERRKQVVVLAVLHEKREQDAWKSRL